MVKIGIHLEPNFKRGIKVGVCHHLDMPLSELFLKVVNLWIVKLIQKKQILGLDLIKFGLPF